MRTVQFFSWRLPYISNLCNIYLPITGYTVKLKSFTSIYAFVCLCKAFGKKTPTFILNDPNKSIQLFVRYIGVYNVLTYKIKKNIFLTIIV